LNQCNYVNSFACKKIFTQMKLPVVAHSLLVPTGSSSTSNTDVPHCSHDFVPSLSKTTAADFPSSERDNW